MLTLLFVFLYGSTLGDMGSPSYQVRERASRKANSFLFALLAPDNHADPEVRVRVERIKDRHIPYRHTDLEVYCWTRQPTYFFQHYLIPARNCKITDLDVLSELHRNQKLREWFREAYPTDQSRPWMAPPIVAGELGMFRSFLAQQNRLPVAALAGGVVQP